MTGATSISGNPAARISAKAHLLPVPMAPSASRSQNPRIIEAKLQGYLS